MADLVLEMQNALEGGDMYLAAKLLAHLMPQAEPIEDKNVAFVCVPRQSLLLSWLQVPLAR